mgnify:FL=1
MLDVIYHNLPKVKNMYRDALNVEFPKIENITKVVVTRHDLVHRNGKTKEGEQVEVSKKMVSELLDTIEKFIKEIDDEIRDIKAS